MKKNTKIIRKEKDWFRLKGYPHIDLPLDHSDKSWIRKYLSDKDKVSSHSFLPLIHKDSKVRRFRKEICHDGTRSKLRKPSEKNRELYYSNHLDSNIYSYYTGLLSKDYEQRLAERGISECVTAYRRIKLNLSDDKGRNKCNVDFANDVFSYIKNNQSTHLVAVTFDIKSFFDTINHKILKKYWKEVIQSGPDLPNDHYNIFRNITKFSFIEERDIFNEFKQEVMVERMPENIKKIPVKKSKYLRNKRAVAYCELSDIHRLRKKNYIKANKYEFLEGERKELRVKGIPQGSPISSVLANLYLLQFDTDAQDFINSKNGLYRRYSDDMVVICDFKYETEIIDYFINSIKSYLLEIQPSKTQVFHFTKNVSNNRFECQEKNLNTKKLQKNTKFEYLGFQFDGHYTLLKSSSIASYYRKMKRSIKRGFFYTNHNKTKTKGELFKNRLYKRFTHLGAGRRRIYQRDRNDKSKFVVTHEFDWGNYLSYAQLAANVIPDNKIPHQLKKHWRIFHRLINDRI